MLPLATVLAAVLNIPHLLRVATRQHLGHEAFVVGRLVARMSVLKRAPVIGKDLLEDIPVPRGLGHHGVAPSAGDTMVAVKRLYHGSPASSTPHRPLLSHSHPLDLPGTTRTSGQPKNAFSYTMHKAPCGRTRILARCIPWSHRYILGSQSAACRPDTHHEPGPRQPPHQ